VIRSVCSIIRTERREEERHKQLYRFLPQTGSSLVPLALSRRVHYNVISDYNCSSTQARDFICTRTQSRDFYAQALKQETSIKQNYKENV